MASASPKGWWGTEAMRAHKAPFPTSQQLQSWNVWTAPPNPELSVKLSLPAPLVKQTRSAASRRELPRPGRDDRRDMCGTPRPGLSALRCAQPSVPRRLSHRVPEPGTSGSLSEVARTRFVLPRCGRGAEQGAAAPGVRDCRRSPHCPPCRLRVPGGCVRRGWKLLLVAGAGGTVAAAPKFAPKVQ